MTRRQYSNTAIDTTLASSIASADTSFALTSLVGYPAPPFTATIGRGEADEEVVLVTGVSSTTVTVTRGYDGTAAKAHTAGAEFLHTAVAKDFDEANAHVNTGVAVHGLAGSVVGTTDAQTLTNKTLTAPTLTSPTVTGTAALSTATVSGTLTVTGATSLTGGLSSTTGTFSGPLSGSSLSTAGTATVTGNASVGGTLTVTGASTLAGFAASGNGTVGGTLVVTGTVSGATPTLAAHLTRKDYVDAADTATLNAAKAYTDSSAAPAGIQPSLGTGFYMFGTTSVPSGTNTTPLAGTYGQALPSSYFTYASGTYTVVKAGIYTIQFQTFSNITAPGSVETRIMVTGGLSDGSRDVRYRGTGTTSAGAVGTVCNWTGYLGAGATFKGFIGHINADGTSVSFDYSMLAQLLVPVNP